MEIWVEGVNNMHHARARIGWVAVSFAIVGAIFGLASPVMGQVPSLALASQVEPPDPNAMATTLLVISLVTVLAIRRKHPELRLFPLAPIPSLPRPSSRPRSRR